MAIYQKTGIESDGVVWCLMSPQNIWEALRIAWYMLRHKDRVAALVGVPNAFIDKNFKQESASEKDLRFAEHLSKAEIIKHLRQKEVVGHG